MLSRVVFIGFVLILLLCSAFFFSNNTSYQDSLQSRVYYFLGNYEEANKYATKAHNADKYNKMAFTVMTQSKIALKYERYIRQGKEYFKTIEEKNCKKKIKLSR